MKEVQFKNYSILHHHILHFLVFILEWDIVKKYFKQP